jgi:flagellar FliL protein
MAKEEKEESELSEEGEEGQENGKSRSGKKLILIIVIILLLLGGVGAGLYFSGMLDSGGEEEVAETGDEGADKTSGATKEEAGLPVFYELPALVTDSNTTAQGRGPTVIRVTPVLEFPAGTDMERIKALEPRIINDFLTYIRELRKSDLVGSAGMYRLREELIKRVNKAVHPAQVNDIQFKEFFVQ